MAARKPRRLPELSADERHRQLFAKYGDLTGAGLVAPTIQQAGELMMRMAASQSAAAATAASVCFIHLSGRRALGVPAAP